MSFRVSARTVLQLGSELISSDAVAIYELVKNAIDAQSKNGVEIDIHVCLSHSTYSEVMRELGGSDPRPLEELTAFLLDRVEATTEPEVLEIFKKEPVKCKTTANLQTKLPDIYATTNWIEIRDTGDGMSEQDIKTKYLVIGTSDRKKAVDDAAAEFAKLSSQKVPATPYLGEKGVGRLSVMRLGWMLELQSATEQDRTLNVLEIDWRDFEDLDLELKDVKIAPTTGGAKQIANGAAPVLRFLASGIIGHLEESGISRSSNWQSFLTHFQLASAGSASRSSSTVSESRFPGWIVKSSTLRMRQ